MLNILRFDPFEYQWKEPTICFYSPCRYVIEHEHKDDHPELDISEELSVEGIHHYQSLIGSFQWAVSLCRYDIHCATMTMGKFRSAARQGHLDRLQRICGYLRKYLMPPYVFGLTSLTTHTWTMSPSTGPILSTVVLVKNFPQTCLHQEGKLFGLPHLRMLI